MEPLPVRNDLVIPGPALAVRTSRASGPGGQHVNKTDSRVSLLLDLEAGVAGWPEALQARVKSKLTSKLTKDGRLIVHVDADRSQPRNLEEARRRMAALLAAALVVPRTRRPTKPTKGSQRRRIAEKRRRAEVKRLRGKVDDP